LLAFFRTFAVPRISVLLDQTGELVAHTRKRADDTLLIMYEIDGRRHHLNLGSYKNGYQLGDVGPEWIRAENAATTKTSGAQS
jgi:hypothetical protein